MRHRDIGSLKLIMIVKKEDFSCETMHLVIGGYSMSNGINHCASARGKKEGEP